MMVGKLTELKEITTYRQEKIVKYDCPCECPLAKPYCQIWERDKMIFSCEHNIEHRHSWGGGRVFCNYKKSEVL